MTITIKTNLLHLHVDTKNRSRHNLLEKDSKNLTTCQLTTPPSHIGPISPPSLATLTSDNSTIETNHEGNHRDVTLKPLYFLFIVSHIVGGIINFNKKRGKRKIY